MKQTIITPGDDSVTKLPPASEFRGVEISVLNAGDAKSFVIEREGAWSLQLSKDLQTWDTVIDDNTVGGNSVTTTVPYQFARLGPAQGGDAAVRNLTVSGTIGIGGVTNLFGTMDIGITRVFNRGEVSKSWINIAQVDDWPDSTRPNVSWTRAGEWWANAGIRDCVTEISWLTPNGPSQQILQHVGDTDEQLYLEMRKNGVTVFRVDHNGDIKTRGNIVTNWTEFEKPAPPTGVTEQLGNLTTQRVSGWAK